MNLEAFISTLWNYEKNVKRLYKADKFNYVYFRNYNGNTFIHFTNSIQYIPEGNSDYAKRFPTYRVAEYIKEAGLI